MLSFDVKAVELQLDEYASQSLKNISEYFLNLHSFLQNEERRILAEFHERCTVPLAKVREATNKLGESQQTLNAMRKELEQYREKMPNDIYVRPVINDFHTKLEHLQCNVKISRIEKNPFSFKVKNDIRKDLMKYINYNYIDPKFSIQLGPMYGDLNRNFHDTKIQNFDEMEMGIAPTMREYNTSKVKEKKDETIEKNKEIPDAHNKSNNTVDTKSDQHSERHEMVRISHVKSPEHFYVQSAKSAAQILEISDKYLDLHNESIPRVIVEGQCYMAYHPEDKKWYRGLVKKILAQSLYKVFLVDIGINLELPKERLCDIDLDSVAIPYAAIRCALYNLMPAEKSWNSEANSLLIEIARNQYMRMSIIEEIKPNILKVDLFVGTNSKEPMSIRDSFLYTGLARERSGASKKEQQFKKMSPVARINQRIPQFNIRSGTMLTVKVSHIENPQLFYVIISEAIKAKQTFTTDLNFFYDKCAPKPIFMAPLKMACVVRMTGFWHRGCVEEVHYDGNICVRFVDEGFQETVHWRQIFELNPQFLTQKEFAIKCSLADVETLQENNYEWTDEAIKEFRQLTSNPVLNMNILSNERNEYMVALNICKKNLAINVGGVLVKHLHCLSTGEASQSVPAYQSVKNRSTTDIVSKPLLKIEQQSAGKEPLEFDEFSKDWEDSKTKHVEKILQRTPIKVVHIKNPGEFYIQIKNLVSGVVKFHRHLQEAQQEAEKKSSSFSLCSQDNKNWKMGEHCLVYVAFKKSIASLTIESDGVSPDVKCEWYRALIVSISTNAGEEPLYSVFLRDVGATVDLIRAGQLKPIAREWDRVTNAVHCCHLACIEPAGDSNTWSHSANDCFVQTVMSYESLSATMQGPHASDSKSIPIVLWGTTIETADPLAPCTTKHSIINRAIVKIGLARIVKRFDVVTQQLEKLLEQELADDEVTMEDWYKNFSENKAIKAIDLTSINSKDSTCDKVDIPKYQDDFIYDLKIEDKFTICTSQAPRAWLRSKPIEKSIFTAIPTYVDYECNIYLHDASDEDLLKQLRTSIIKIYGGCMIANDFPRVYSVGQACLALYHMDKTYYRAIIKEHNAEDQYIVTFIDYGNVETVEIDELLPFAPYPKMPRFATKYRLQGIRPKPNDITYTTDALDLMHSTVVDKLVSVRVVEMEKKRKNVKYCTLRVGKTNVAEFLISTGMFSGAKRVQAKLEDDELEVSREAIRVRNRKSDDDFNIQKEYDSAEHKINDTSDSENYSLGDVDDTMNDCLDELLQKLDKQENNMDTDSFIDDAEKFDALQEQSTFVPPCKKRMFEIKEYKQLAYNLSAGADYSDEKDEIVDMECEAEGATATKGETSIPLPLNVVNDDDDDDEAVVELEQSFARNYWHAVNEKDEDKDSLADVRREEMESSLPEKFVPNDSSSVFSHFSGIDVFMQSQLPIGLRSFHCSVVCVLSPTMVQIKPHVTELEFREVELQRRIKHVIKGQPQLTKFDPNTICLSCFEKDKKWYRALLRSYNPVAKQADVLYVDYFLCETVPIKYLKECPSDLLKWPLRTTRARLYGLEPNSRMRQKDIHRALHNTLIKRTLLAKIKGEQSTRNTNIPDVYTGSVDCGVIEVSLYDASEAPSNRTVYDSLVQDNFYNTI